MTDSNDFDMQATAKTTFTGPGSPAPTRASEPAADEPPAFDAATERARNVARDARTSAEAAHDEATTARDSRIAAQEAAIDARELSEQARRHAAASRAAADDCRASVGELRDASRSLSSSVQTIDLALKARARADREGADRPLSHSAQPEPPTTPVQPDPPTTPVQPVYSCQGRPADEIAASMSQLNTLLLGSSPAFAHAMRLQTDAIASGLGVLNAISNQQSHYALEIASTARGIVETHARPVSRPAGGDAPGK